jgi:hypothetical protein
MDPVGFRITSCEDARPGDMAELMGANVTLNEIAAASGTAT